MSESQTLEQTQTAEPMALEDLQKMYDEARERSESLAKERDQERQGRLQAERQVATERNARLVTESERDTNAGRIVSEAEAKYAAQKNAVKSGLTAQENILSTAESAYERALELGDHKAAAAANRQIAEAAAEVSILKQQSAHLEANKSRYVPDAPKVEQRQHPQQPALQPSTDALTAIVPNLLASERAFLEARPQFLTDPDYQAQVFDASNIASRKHVRGSDGYIKEIARILGEDAPVQQQQPVPQRQASTDLAPQRRASPGASPQGGRQEWSITAEQAEIANGMWGNPGSDGYIANEAERYKHYWDMQQKRAASGRV